MTWPPPPLPPIPQEIEMAANECNLVVFIGAGVSKLVGCPSWDEFADSVLDQLATDGHLSFSDVQQLSCLDAKKRLSIADQIAESKGYQFDYKTIIEPRKKIDSKVYDYLINIGCVYVTTNYDRFLDNPLTVIKSSQVADQSTSQSQSMRELVCQPDQLMPSVLRKPGGVIHLHGSIEKPETMIVSTTDYLTHYSDERVITFLTELFETNTVLFIGYGLEETEILEHIFRKIRRDKDKSTRKIFMLQGFYSHQEKTYSHLYDYYKKSFQVYLCPFNLDQRNYKQLEKVIEEWSSKLKIGQPVLADDYNYVMKVADESS
jgi:hypothetical protein